MDLLRRAFRDIAAGHTRGQILGRTAYIKHLSYADQIEFDEKRERFYEDARSIGIKTDEERLTELRTEGAWSDAKELELTRARQNVDALIEGKTKARARMPSAVKDYLRKIDEAKAAYEEKLLAKRQLLGITCEVSADREVNDYYIVENLFADPALTQPLFAELEFDYLSDEQVSNIVRDYNAAMECCSEFNVKKLAMSGLFQRSFQLCGDDYTAMFGRPICALTFLQLDVLRYGAHFLNIYQNHDTSQWKKEVLEDPDLMIEYADSISKKKQELEKQGANEPGAIVIGAKQEDAKVLGVKGASPVDQIMTKFGGNVMEWAAQRGG